MRFVAASVHTAGYIFRQFRSAVERVEKSDDGVREHLELLAKFYGLWQMEEKAAFFLRSGFLTPDQLDFARPRSPSTAPRRVRLPSLSSTRLPFRTTCSTRPSADTTATSTASTSAWCAVTTRSSWNTHTLSVSSDHSSSTVARDRDFDEAIGIDDEIEVDQAGS